MCDVYCCLESCCERDNGHSVPYPEEQMVDPVIIYCYYVWLAAINQAVVLILIKSIAVSHLPL